MLAACAIAAATITGFAQPKQNDGWKSRMKSEMVAFITTELNLSPEEAQSFWPVYNQAAEKRFEANRGVMEAMKQMLDAEDGADYKALMNNYSKALQNREKVEGEYVETLRKSFGDEKAAKLILTEEKFRRNQINRLNGGGPRPEGNVGPGHEGNGGPRPEGGHRGPKPGPRE